MNQDSLAIIIKAILDKKQTESQINAQIKEIKAKSLEIGITVTDKEAKKHLSDFQKSVEREAKQIKSALNIDLDKIKLSNNMSSWLNENSRAAKMFGDRIRDLQVELQNVSSKEELTSVTKKFQAATSEARALGVTGKTALDSLATAASRLTQYFGVAAMFSTAIHEMRKAFTELKEIDTQLTQLSKVTDIVKEDFKSVAIEAADSANKWGRTASDYLSASETFAKAGAENYKQLADVSILAQSAGDLSAELASKYLIASSAAFQLGNSSEKLTELLDSQNQVTNRNAVSMEDMALATQVYANTAAISGESTQSMTAAIAAGVGATQKSGNEVGRALRTLSMNIRQIKGETEDGIIDEDSMGKAEKALNSVGISTRTIRDGIADLKQPTEVLGELAEKFKAGEVNAEQLAIILEDVGSKRQADLLAAMVQNWDLYTKAMSDFTDANGSAAREAQKDLESWEGKLNVLSNTWVKFVGNTIDTSWIKGLLDVATGLVNVMDKLGAFPILIGSITAALSIKNNAGKVNMPTIYEVINNNDTSMWESCTYHTGGKPLDCWKRLRAA